jgi:predicted nucleic acid-binding protein
MIYLDASSLLKLLWNEPESSTTIDVLAEESTVVVSVLAEMETLVQLKAAYLGGDYSLPQLRRFEAQLAVFRNQPPYEFRTLPGTVFQTALRQHRNSGGLHCRSLDRLHLAAMEELKVSRLMTHDEGQAKAAIEAGFEVVRPGRD